MPRIGLLWSAFFAVPLWAIYFNIRNVESTCIFDMIEHDRNVPKHFIQYSTSGTVSKNDVRMRRAVGKYFEAMRIHVHYFGLEELVEDYEKARVIETIRKTVKKAQDIFSGW